MKSIAPEKIPMISEKYTSLVASANTIVIIGGKSEIADDSNFYIPFQPVRNFNNGFYDFYNCQRQGLCNDG